MIDDEAERRKCDRSITMAGLGEEKSEKESEEESECLKTTARSDRSITPNDKDNSLSNSSSGDSPNLIISCLPVKRGGRVRASCFMKDISRSPNFIFWEKSNEVVWERRAKNRRPFRHFAKALESQNTNQVVEGVEINTQNKVNSSLSFEENLIVSSSEIDRVVDTIIGRYTQSPNRMFFSDYVGGSHLAWDFLDNGWPEVSEVGEVNIVSLVFEGDLCSMDSEDDIWNGQDESQPSWLEQNFERTEC